MARSDYLPAAGGDLVTWLTNYTTQLAALAATFNLAAAEVAAVEAASDAFRTSVTTLAARKAEQQAASAAKQAARKAVEALARPLNRRLRTHPAFRTALGEQLGIVGPEDTTDLNTERPTLTLKGASAGSVTVGFTKSVSTGVRILCKRGPETAFAFLAVDTESPYVDTRPNLGPGAETRHYQAQYLDGDEPVGQISNVLVVAVPG